ncbi:unnamed protein product [Sphenostylis stenocarpa]|uniref:Uncharacterized protein n=1 Tax=Sphenostylis stenocarpa TaxID=92480 RepID=A0AA86VGR2_9FABA|nr:unnamed protein product [Sphenostylis stenocarpa]
MEKNTVDYSPLLTPRGDENASKTASSSLPVKGLFSKWTNLNRDSQFKANSVLCFARSIFVVFTAPLLIIAFLAIAHLNLTGEDQLQGKKSSKYPSIRLWTFPVLIKGPFGVVSAAELIGIVLFLLYVVWATYVYTVEALGLISETHQLSSKAKRFNNDEHDKADFPDLLELFQHIHD